MKFTFIKDESIRIFFLVGVSCFFYYPFFSSQNIGANDAQYYLYMLHDFLVQARAGFFPAYVTQSIYLPHGNPIILAPYYAMLGSALNLILFLNENILLTQHLCIVATAILSNIVVYLNIKSIFKSLSWEAAILSSLYIGSPALMALIYKMDMYLSFMVAPFIPVVFLQILIIINSDKLSPINIIFLACALSLTWMSHPPIALWLSIMVCILCIPYVRKRFLDLLLAALLFLLLSCWQLIPILTFEIDSVASLPSSQVASIVQELKSSLPDSLLPLRTGSSGLFFLQLGYSLWFLMLLGGALTFLRSKNTAFRLIFLLAILITLLLFPITELSVLFWLLVPSELLKVTYTWPNQRLYVILAALSCCLGAYFLDYINTNHKAKHFKKLIPMFLALLFSWSVYEGYYFVSSALKSNTSQYMASFKPNSWQDSENIVSFKHYLPKDYTQNLKSSEDSNELALLNSRLLNTKFRPVPYASNYEFLTSYCVNYGSIHSNILSNTEVSNGHLQTENYLNLDHGLNYVCISALLSTESSKFELIDKQRRRMAYIRVKSQNDSLVGPEFFGIPIYVDKESLKNSPYQLLVEPELPKNSLKTIKTVLVPPYDKFPIKIESYTPYQAFFDLRNFEASYLEVDKAYFSGYSAKVNEETVKPIKSKYGSILIPLNANENEQHITLRFEGLPIFRITFFISALTWLAAIIFLSFLLVRKSKFYALSPNH